MEFQAQQVGDFQCFVEQVADVGDVGQRGFCADVAFAAENHVVRDGEVVAEAVFFRRGAGDELREQRLECVHLSGVDFEIRVDADDVVWLAHGVVLLVEISTARFSVCETSAAAKSSWLSTASSGVAQPKRPPSEPACSAAKAAIIC